MIFQLREVAATLRSTLTRLDAPARAVLQITALLAPDAIALPWLRAIVGQFHPELARDAALGQADPWTQLIHSLMGMRVFLRTQDPRVVSIHRILQSVLEAELREDRTDFEVALLDHVRSRTAALEKTTRWGEARWELEPLEALAWLWAGPQESDEPVHEEAAWLLNHAGQRRHDLAEWAFAEPLMRRALSIDEASYREVVMEYERALGPEHRDTLSSRNNLALVLDALGKHVEATAEFRKLLPQLEKYLGPRHPETLETRNNFANTLLSQGAYAEAESELRKTLELRVEVLGPGHRSTLTSRNNLAWGLILIGKNEEAEHECREALAGMQGKLPDQHPLVLSTRDTLAEALRSQGKLVEAVAENRTVLEVSERTRGAEHPGTLLSHFHMAQCLKALNNNAEAITHARLAAQGAIKVFGPEHSETKKYGALLKALETTP